MGYDELKAEWEAQKQAEHTSGEDAATGPCLGCGETNHTAHNVSICAACLGAVRENNGRRYAMTSAGMKWIDARTNKPPPEHPCRNSHCERQAEFCTEHANGQECMCAGCDQLARICVAHSHGDAPHLVNVSFTPFEAAMVLCVLAVAKTGISQYDTADLPIRRRALEHAYKRLSSEMSVPAVSEGNG